LKTENWQIARQRAWPNLKFSIFIFHFSILFLPQHETGLAQKSFVKSKEING